MDSDRTDIDRRSAGSENRSYVSEDNVLLIREFQPSPGSSSYSDSSEEDSVEFATKKETRSLNDIASTFGHIQKLIRYLKTGNHTATTLALTCLKDEDLESNTVQEAIRNTDGLEILVNLLETENRKCKIAALIILKRLTHNKEMARRTTNLGAVPNIVTILDDTFCIFQKLSAEIITNLCRVRKTRKIVRKTGGLPKLVALLNVPSFVSLKTRKSDLNAKEREIIDVVEAVCKTLCSVSVSYKNKLDIYKLGAMKHFTKLLQSCHEDIIIATLGIITHCSHLGDFRTALQNEGAMEYIVGYLSNENDEIKKHSALIIFECAGSKTTSNLVRQYGGLDPLIHLLASERVRQNRALLAAATGAVWKCSSNIENIRRLDELETISLLVQLLNSEEEEVLVNVAGAIAECVKSCHNQETLLKTNGIPALLNQLNYQNENLLENVTSVLALCAGHKDCLQQIVQNDGIRLLWSLLRHNSTRVQSSTAWALVPCIQNANDSAEMIRSFAGGFELLISLLESTDTKVLSCVCATVAEVAKNEDNLAIMTDLGVVDRLAKLVPLKDEMLKEHLASAIANCCTWESNCAHFGKLNMVRPLVSFMLSKNIDVQRATALALHRLSSNPYNSVTLHRSGVVKLLLKSIGSTNSELQEASAGCLSNIRKLALKLSHKSITQ